MRAFTHLNQEMIELAAIAAGCRPCLDYHFKKALEAGCSKEQIVEVIELGKMIKQRPINDIYEHADKLLNS